VKIERINFGGMKLPILTLLAVGYFGSSLSSAQTCPSGNSVLFPADRFEILEPDNLAFPGQLVVNDLRTGLVWKQCSEGLSGQGCLTGSAVTIDWGSALRLAEAATHGGFEDWRLPNRDELKSVVETACYSPSVNSDAFPNTVSGGYWSSTTYFQNATNAWSVGFSRGNYNFLEKTAPLRVRLVRGGSWYIPQAIFRDGFEK
jgi:hypothetical protein